MAGGFGRLAGRGGTSRRPRRPRWPHSPFGRLGPVFGPTTTARGGRGGGL